MVKQKTYEEIYNSKEKAERHKQKLRDNAKINPNYGMKGKKGYWAGKHHTEEWKMNLKENIKNNPNYGNRGRKASEETLKRMRLTQSNRTPEIRKNMSLAQMGKKANEETKLKMRESHLGEKNVRFGKHHSQESLRKQSLVKIGEKNPNWQNGKSFEPYNPKFNKITKKEIRERDNYRCQQCFRHQSELRTKRNKPCTLNIHHIDFNKKNNNPSNLISLCKNCHSQTGFNRERWTKYFQNKQNLNIIRGFN